MRRLSKYDRNKMVNVALARAFDEEYEKLEKEEDALAKALYEAAFGIDTLAKVKSVMDWVDLSHFHRFEVCGLTFEVRSIKAMPEPRISYPVARINKPELRDKIMDVKARKKELDEKKASSKAMIEALVESVTTLKRLKEIWPDGKEVWSCIKEDAPLKTCLPAVHIDKVNEILRLP